jgi:hypothetical protein
MGYRVLSLNLQAISGKQYGVEAGWQAPGLEARDLVRGYRVSEAGV